MARDLSGRAGLDEVCGAMTDLAEVAVSKALDEDLVVVGMGKLGGRELNVSSDIDLVFLYPGSPDAQERYERAGRRLIQLPSEQHRGRLRVPRRHAAAARTAIPGRSRATSRRSSTTSSPRAANGSATRG